jgi:hypothetical protein
MSRPMKAIKRLRGVIYILFGTSLGARTAGRRRSVWKFRCATQRLLDFTQNTSRQSWFVGLETCQSRLQRRYRSASEHFKSFYTGRCWYKGFRNHKLRIKNDIYSHGVSAELTMSHPSASTVAAFQPDITKIIPISSVLRRERLRPDSLLTAVELYFILAMAAKHCTLLDTKSINVGFITTCSLLSWPGVVTRLDSILALGPSSQCDHDSSIHYVNYWWEGCYCGQDDNSPDIMV